MKLNPNSFSSNFEVTHVEEQTDTGTDIILSLCANGMHMNTKNELLFVTGLCLISFFTDIRLRCLTK
jgi:hypothetical protein